MVMRYSWQSYPATLRVPPLVTVMESAMPPIIFSIFARAAGGMLSICCFIWALCFSISAAASFMRASASARVNSEYSFFLWSMEMILPVAYSTMESLSGPLRRIFSFVKYWEVRAPLSASL